MKTRFAVCLLLFATSTSAQVTLQFTAPANNFHIGERVPLTLVYSAPAGSHAKVNPGLEGRRTLGSPTIGVTPSTGWVDPQAHRAGYAFSGAMQMPVDVSIKPLTRTIDLAEYVRFQQPGDYTVVVRSSTGNPFEPNAAARTPQIVSQPLKLHIEAASPEWQAATLSAAKSLLATLPAPRPGNDPTAREARNALYGTIADLGTDAAIREMAANLHDPKPGEWDDRQQMYTAALVGLPEDRRATALEAMRSVVRQPNSDISYSFFSTFTTLHNRPDDASTWQQSADAAWNEAAATLPSRSVKGRAELADLLARSGELTPVRQAALAPYIIAGFADLPLDRKLIALQASWPLLRSAAMLPELERLARMPRYGGNLGTDGNHGLTAANTNEVRALGLRRWYELDPAAARAFALQEIGTDHPSFSARQLSFLPRDPMPQFESLWATALSSAPSPDTSNLLSLLATFGAGTATAQVGLYVDTALAARRHPCAYVDMDAVAYLVRFDTAHARTVLNTIREAAAANPHCGLPFTMIAQTAHGPALEEAAIAALDAPAHQAAEAARYLQRYGTSAARTPIEEHLRTYLASATNTTPPAFDGTPASMERMMQIGLGQAMVAAAIAPPGLDAHTGTGRHPALTVPHAARL